MVTPLPSQQSTPSTYFLVNLGMTYIIPMYFHLAIAIASRQDNQIHDLRVTQIPDFWISYMRLWELSKKSGSLLHDLLVTQIPDFWTSYMRLWELSKKSGILLHDLRVAQIPDFWTDYMRLCQLFKKSGILPTSTAPRLLDRLYEIMGII